MSNSEDCKKHDFKKITKKNFGFLGISEKEEEAYICLNCGILRSFDSCYITV